MRTIADVVAWLQDFDNQDMEVLVETEVGAVSICGESGEIEVEGVPFLLLKPCMGHSDAPIEFDVRPDDFDLNLS